MNERRDVTNRFLAVEIWLPPIAIIVAGAISYGSLASDVEHKADKRDVAVISEKVETIEETVDVIKTEQKKMSAEQIRQRTILERIDRKLDNGE